jgi:iron(III) transport system substrate-binding protein
MGFSQISTAFIALCVALSLSACGGAAPTAPGNAAEALTTVPSSTSEELKEAARKEGSLLWYSSKPTPTVSALAAAFEDEYGIRVETYKAGGSQVLAKVESELSSGRLIADVVDYSDVGAAVSQAERGVFAQYAPERSSLVPGELRSAEGFWTIYGPYSARIAYNPNLLTEQEAPKSWEELKDEQWRGKIGMASPDYAGSAVMTIHGWQK